jgi:hypothetical protein
MPESHPLLIIAAQMDCPSDIMLNLTHCLSLLLKCLFLGNFVTLSGEHFLFLFPLTPFSFVFYVICQTASVPDSVKAELLQRIRSFLMSSSLR